MTLNSVDFLFLSDSSFVVYRVRMTLMTAHYSSFEFLLVTMWVRTTFMTTLHSRPYFTVVTSQSLLL